jgi:sec-independent protein translocase protein TatA
MGDLFQPWHIIIVAGLAVLLFGGKKLPELGKGLGESIRGFKEALRGDQEKAEGSTPSDKTPPQT